MKLEKPGTFTARTPFAYSFAISSLLLTAAGSAFARDASDPMSAACISPSAEKELNSCVAGQSLGAATGKAPAMSFHSVPPPVTLKKRDASMLPGAPTEQMAASQRDDRKSRMLARQRALLVIEIQQIESLFRATPPNATDRATIARRLAETYVELESAAFRDKTQAEIERDNLRKSDSRAAGEKQALANQANGIMIAARKRAEQYYTLIKDEYPTYPQLDEVLYYLAYEYEQANEAQNARKAYFELIQKKPDSKYVPNAYLAFGELFFNDAQGDPSKWALADEAYRKVIGYPPPESKVYGYAWYKLAYVAWNRGEFAEAINAFKKTIDFGAKFSQLTGATKLADSARRDIVPVYALRGDPAGAYGFFRNIAADEKGSSEKTFAMMNDLGQNYLDTGHYAEAIILYKDLSARDRGGDGVCAYHAKITEATMAMKSGNKEAVKAELENQLRAYKEFVGEEHPAAIKHQCANKTAELVSETAMAWHLEAVGSQGQRGTGDKKAMALAANLYKHAVDTWSVDEFATFEFPRLVREDWPTIYKVKYNMADLLYFEQQWAECGPAFDAVVAENPSGPEASEAAYASVLCYQNVYEAAHAKGEDRRGSGNMPGAEAKKSAKNDGDARLKPKELTATQRGMLNAFNRYVCYVHPEKKDVAGAEKLVEVKYARARTYFEAQHWDQAASAFREIALEHADKEVGIYAAQLYLESVNVLGAHSSPPRPACFDQMGGDVPRLLELYCSGDKRAKNAEQCVTLTKIQCDIQRLKAQKITEIADAEHGPGAARLYETAGNTYFEVWRTYGESAIRTGQAPQCDRLDEVVYNAAKAYQAGRLIAKAIAARVVLLNPLNRMQSSELAKKATYEIGGNYQAIAVYDQAADWFEKYAKAYPKADKADVALSDAALLRLGLGDEEKAIADGREFNRIYGVAKPVQAAAIAFAVGVHYADNEDWEKARGALQGALKVIEKAPLDIQVQAHATLARANAKLKHATESTKKYAKVRALWADPEASVKRIVDGYPDEDELQKRRRVAKALNAVGEAIFQAADDMKAANVDKLRFPEYRGHGKRDEVLKHINVKVRAWLETKTPAIEKVAAEYKKVVDLQPEAPPKWVIAAGSRVGLMWGEFVDDFRRAPIPDGWKKDPEMRGVYYDALDAKSEPIKVQRAKPALVTCLAYSVKFEYFDAFSRSCEVWLGRNYKSEYHVVDELRGVPSLANSPLNDRAPAINLGGLLVHAPVEPAGPASKSARKSIVREEAK